MSELILRITEEEQELITMALLTDMEHYRPGSETYNKLDDLRDKIWSAESE